MNRFIDMHCHILPGVDDGSQTPEETKEMLRQEWEEGTRVIVATPHYHKTRGKNDLVLIKEQLVLTRKLAREVHPKLQVCLGMEIYYSDVIPELLKTGEVIPIRKSRYVLVEFSPGDSFRHMQNAVKLVQMKGYSVVVAHIERYTCLRNDISNVEYLKEMGAYLQVNTGSIVGDYGRNVKKFLREILKRNLADLVGTDAHNTAKRRPSMQKAYEEVKKLCGQEYADCIFEKNARKMLKNEEITDRN
ncbi:hypothetical protein B5F13_07100 [Drancourtella sp. An177]|nr:hypothetical protein B5F13_07100 [Drancourtella sp. An177]